MFYHEGMPRDWEGGASQFSHLQGEIGHVFLIPDTTNGTAIYAAPLTPLAPPQLIGIYGIHGVSGYWNDSLSLSRNPRLETPETQPDAAVTRWMDGSLRSSPLQMSYATIICRLPS